jgi:CTP:molybdopterin cytidylyltransferase MocA
MGWPKALMPTPTPHPGPWWRFQAGALALAGVPATWVVSEAVARALRPHRDAPASLVIARDDAPMFSSLHTGLHALDLSAVQGVFVLPVDTPAPAPGVWSTLARSGELSVPNYRGKNGHPVFLPVAWVRATLEEIDRSRADPNTLRLDTLIATAVRTIPVDDGRVVVNLNTMSDVGAYFKTSPGGGEDAPR